VSPVVSSSGVVHVSISRNAADFSSQTMQFLYHSIITIDSVSPSTGPEAGGTDILILGSGFAHTNDLECLVGSTSSPATFLRHGQILCSIPQMQHSIGETLISVSNNGQQYSSSTSAYTFYPQASVTSVSPSSGPVHGGTIVNVFGTGFVNNTVHSCQFGDTVVPATFLHSTQTQCETPSNFNENATLEVSITNNGQNFASSVALFEYAAVTSVSHVTPRSGHNSGGTVLHVHGKNFKDTGNLLQCRFNFTTTQAAVFVSDTEIRCVLPSYSNMQGGSVMLEITTNGVDFVGGGPDLSIQVHEAETVEYLEPSRGTITGGLDVLVWGSNFQSSPTLSCIFGKDIAVKASWISNELIRCTTPAVTAQQFVTVDVTSNLVDVSTTNITFEYIHNPIICEIFPSSGSTQGGTEIQIRGSGLDVLGDVRCRFGVIDAPAHVVNETQMSCISPPSVSSGTTQLKVLDTSSILMHDRDLTFEYVSRISLNSIYPKSGPLEGGTEISVSGHGFPTDTVMLCNYVFYDEMSSTTVSVRANVVSDTSAFCTTPQSEKTSLVVFSLSSTRNEPHSRALHFAYESLPTISKLSPSSGSLRGGDVVHVHGTGFSASKDFQCRFGEFFVPATFLGETYASCVVPSSKHPSKTSIEITTNGVDFSDSKILYEYHSRVVVAAVVPEQGPSYGGT